MHEHAILIQKSTCPDSIVSNSNSTGPFRRLFQLHRSKADGRSVSLRLTNKGNKALARDPFEVLVRAVDSLDLKERTAMRQALHQLLTTVVASGAHRRFGVCQDCTYFGGERCCNPTIASPSLLGVSIQPEDAGLLCVHFRPTSDHRNSGHRIKPTNRASRRGVPSHVWLNVPFRFPSCAKWHPEGTLWRTRLCVR